jgi:hypothetical protein
MVGHRGGPPRCPTLTRPRPAAARARRPGYGYRYYHADQFARLNRIIALKEPCTPTSRTASWSARHLPAAWIENGYRSLGYPREVNLECPPGDHRKW